MNLFPALSALIQRDVGNRGLARQPGRNLLTACPQDLEQACRGLAEPPGADVAVVTGFFIPTAHPPAGETDGPLGAVFLARALFPLGIRVRILTDAFAAPAVQAAINMCGLRNDVPVIVLSSPKEAAALGPARYRQRYLDPPPTHLIALERVGPAHTLQSVQHQFGTETASSEVLLDFIASVPEEDQDRCHTMRGIDVTDRMSPAHWLFEGTPSALGSRPALHTIGIGDGGNEIGMGKIPWDIIRDNIPNGARIACRSPVDHLIVCGVSNWGAYALAAGVYHVRGKKPGPELFHVENERRILRTMVEKGPLVDGVLGKPMVSVDGLAWEDYASVLKTIGEMFQ